MVHTAIYDAWAFYNEPHRGVYLIRNNTFKPSTETDEDIKKSISYAAYRVLVDLYPTSMSDINERMNSWGYNVEDTSLDIKTSSGIGNQAAQLLLLDRWADGSNQKGDVEGSNGKNYSDWTNYAPRNDESPKPMRCPDNWQPLLVPTASGNTTIQSFTTPQWSMLKSFSMADSGMVRPSKAPATWKNPKTRDELKRQAMELVSYTTTEMTDLTKVISEYWADGPKSVTPPGHWNIFAQFVSQRDNNTLERDVKLFFMLGNALMDSSIACWDCKRFYDNTRPATMIPFLFNGTVVNGWNGPCTKNLSFDLVNWKPYQNIYFVTPPFPDFTSGHSTFSASAAEILKRFTGSDNFGYSVTIKAGSSIIDAGCGVPAEDITLSWATFSEASQEAGFSRRYGGIHYQDADLAGREGGLRVANFVYSKSELLFQGLNPSDRETDGGAGGTPNNGTKSISSNYSWTFGLILVFTFLSFI
eukprot:gene5281-6574_t